MRFVANQGKGLGEQGFEYSMPETGVGQPLWCDQEEVNLVVVDLFLDE